MIRKDAHNPPRLVDSPDMGPLLRGALATDVDDRRLTINRAAMFARLSEVSAPSAGRARRPIPLRRRFAVVAVAATVLCSAGAAAVLYVVSRAADPNTDAAPQSLPAPGNAAARLSVGAPASEGALAEAESSAGVPDAGAPAAAGARNKKRRGPDSTLEKQALLFNRAKERLSTGDSAAALVHLRQLRQRYPGSPLMLEARELSARAFADLGRYGEASRAVAALIGDLTATRKKAQLYRFLGDIQIKQGRCDQAVVSYRRALGLGLSSAETRAAKAGIRKCGDL